MENFLKDAIDNLNLGVCVIDKNKIVSYWNKGAENLTGFLSNEIIGKKFELIEIDCPIEKSLKDGEQRKVGAAIKHKTKKPAQISIQVVPNRDAKDELIGATAAFHDISSEIVLINKVKELERTASYDFLTQLPNRRMFEKILNAKIEELQRGSKPFGIVFIDIDNFKKVNDLFGHDMGDLILKAVSKKLLSTLRPYDTLGRWGGEEFVALVSHVDREQLHVIANRLRSMVERMSVFNGDSVIKVTLSIGATLAKDGDSIHKIISRADKLMYASKNSGKNKVTLEARTD